MMSESPKPWSADQVALLYLLAPAARPLEWATIAEACEHPLGSCRVTWVKLRAHLAAGKPLAGFGNASRGSAKRRWTEAEAAELFRLRTVENLGFFEIDALFNRARGASSTKFRQLFGAPPERNPALPPGAMPPLRAIHAPRHLPQHTTLTAKQFGDPLPGRSVWDRIQAGILEPPVYLGRAARHPAKITLPGGPLS